MYSRNELKERYLIAYKNYKERLKLFNDLLNDAIASNIEEFAAFFEGMILWLNKDFDKAIECFNKAIEIDKIYATPWNNLGDAYNGKKDYDKAIECYEKSIELDKNLAYPWVSLGDAYNGKKDYDKAIECYEKAIELDKDFHYPWNGLGNVYLNKEEYDKAIKCYEKAVKIADETKEFYDSSIYKGNIEKAKAKKAIMQQVVETTDLVTMVLKATVDNKIVERADEAIKKFAGFLVEKPNKIEAEQIYLKVLRRWNSYTPIITDPYHISKGGGYFIKIKGYGIVIDPGFNFIENFKGVRGGHLFHEIDYVLITHAHNDHTNDLESIITLLHKHNEVIYKFICKRIAEERNIPFEDAEKKYKLEIDNEFDKKKKRIHIYLTNSVAKKYSGFINLESTEYYSHTVEKNTTIKLENSTIEVKVIKASHYDLISNRDSVGFIFDFGDSVLIYTGDTGWTSEIKEQYKNIADIYKDKFRILIAHLGGFKEKEFDYYKDPDGLFYKNHLGRIGMVGINETLKPKVCLISEFGEEFKERDGRNEIVGIFNKAFKEKGYDIIFLPADIGLTYNFLSQQIEAIIGINYEINDPIYDFIKPEDVNVTELIKDNSLHYYNNILKPSVIVQYLAIKYESSLK